MRLGFGFTFLESRGAYWIGQIATGTPYAVEVGCPSLGTPEA
jgi:hypothetical protein